MRGAVLPVVVACAVAACASNPSAEPTTTSAPSTTAPSTIAATTTSTAATTSTSTSVMGAGACVERVPAASAAPDHVFPTFGPLGTSPSVVIDVPRWEEPSATTVERSFGALEHVPGGVVVAVSSAQRSDVVMVDLDGSMRWRRCFADNVAVFVPKDPTGVERVLVWHGRGNDPGVAEVLDLRDGSSQIPAGLAGIGDGGGDVRFLAGRVLDDRALLRPFRIDGSIPPAPWRTIDLRTFEVGTFDPPAEWPEGDIATLSDGRTAWTVRGDHPVFAVVVAIRDGEVWVPPGDLSGVWLREVYRWQDDVDGRTMPAAYGADGTRWWARPDLVVPSGELVAAKAVDDVVVTSVCSDRSCTDVSLMGLDLRTGETRWTQPDFAFVGPGVDGFALVDAQGEPARSAVIQTDTGAVVSGQVFEGQGWPEGCCADPATTVIAGGVVFAATERAVRVYLPAAAATPTVTVSMLE